VYFAFPFFESLVSVESAIRMADLKIDPVICEAASAGLYAAIRIGFAFPMVERNSLPPKWVREYTVSGLIVHDPVMTWAYSHVGVIRWSEIGGPDTQGVLELAKAHGLNFGAVSSWIDPEDDGQRSFGIFCRFDREFEDAELALFESAVRQWHRAHARPKNLTAAELETLGLVKNGLLLKEISALLGISESAVKQRLRGARMKLKSKTGLQAAATATMLGMI
jgi:LuxR family transcriptional regulator